MMYEFSHLVFSHHKGVSEMINMTRIWQNLDICTHESIFIIFARFDTQYMRNSSIAYQHKMEYG